MKTNWSTIAGALSALALLVGAPGAAHAWSYTATGQWASFNFGKWTVYQNEWGSTAPCTLYANYYGNFASAGTWSGSGTKGYPHTQADLDLDLRGGHSVQCGWNTSSPTVRNSSDRWLWNPDRDECLRGLDHMERSLAATGQLEHPHVLPRG